MEFYEPKDATPEEQIRNDARMSIAAARRLLGVAKSLSDDQIQRIRDDLYEFAGAAIDSYQGFLERAGELDDYTMSLDGDTPFYHLMGWGLEELADLEEAIDEDLAENQAKWSEEQE
jgi:hypothetical protein